MSCVQIAQGLFGLSPPKSITYRCCMRRSSNGHAAPVATVVLVVTVSLLMSIMMLGTAPPASAQFFQSSCSEGTLTRAATCEIEGQPPVQGLTCPDRALLEFEDGVCFLLINPSSTGVCPSGTTDTFEVGDLYCKRAVELEAGALCADGLELIGSRCLRYVNEFGLSCELGVLVINECVEQGQRAEPTGPLTCPTSTPGVIQDGDDCFTLERGVCPAGSGRGLGDDRCVVLEAVLGGGLTCSFEVRDGACLVSVDFEVGDSACPRDARGVAGSCYVIDPIPPSCPVGVVVGNRCEIYADPPIAGECDTGFAPAANDRCLQWEDAVPAGPDAPCPSGAVRGEYGQCRRPVGDAATRYYCEQPNSQLVENPQAAPSCLRTGVVICADNPGVVGCTTDVVCPEGATPDGSFGDDCRIPAAAEQRPEDCPDGARGAVDVCFIFASKLPPSEVGGFGSCRPNAFEDSLGRCVRPVANARGAYSCDQAHERLEGKKCLTGIGALIGCANPQMPATCPSPQVCPDGLAVMAENPRTCSATVPAAESDPRCGSGRGQAPECVGLVPRPDFGRTCAESSYLEDDFGRCYYVFTGQVSAGRFCPSANAKLEFDLQLNTYRCAVNVGFEACSLPQALSAQCGTSEQQCPVGYSPDDSLGGLCAQFTSTDVSSRPAYHCANPDDAVSGTPCVVVFPFIDPTQVILTCPVDATIETQGQCYRLVAATDSCPDATTPDPGSELCRRPVELLSSSNRCDGGFVSFGIRCFRYAAPDGLPNLDCAGSDAGQVVCDNTIKSSQESPGGELLEGGRTNVTYTGCSGGSAYLLVFYDGVTTGGGPMPEESAGVYSGFYFAIRPGGYRLTVSMECPDGRVYESVENVIAIDTFGPRGNGYVALAPDRVLDSRPGQLGQGANGVMSTPWGAGETRSVQVTGVGGVPTLGVSAVAMHVTSVSPTADSYLTVWPEGQRPLAASKNFGISAEGPLNHAGLTNDLLVVAAAGDGTVQFYNNAGTVDFVVDIVGYFTTTGGDLYNPLPPSRILDSRPGESGQGTNDAMSTPWAAGETRSVQVTSVGGVSSHLDVSAVALQVTSVSPTADSYLTAWGDGARPFTASKNFGVTADGAFNHAGLTNDLLVVPVGFNDTVQFYNNAGTVDFVVDVVGYYTRSRGYFVDRRGEAFNPLSPSRILDSRPNESGQGANHGFSSPWGARETRTVQVTGLGNVPADGVSAVAMHVTSVSPTADSYLTVWPDGVRPRAASKNFGVTARGPFNHAGLTNNLLIVPVSSDGTVQFYNNAGTVDLVVDIVGYYD